MGTMGFWIFGIFYIHNVFPISYEFYPKGSYWFFVVHNVLSLCSEHVLQAPKMFLITLHFYHISCAKRCVPIMYISKPKGKT